MTATVEDFLGLPEIGKLSVIDRFVALLWWHHQYEAGTAIEFGQLCQEVHNAGYAETNKSREKAKLAKDTRTVRPNGGTTFRLNVKAVQCLDDSFLELLENPPARQSNTLFAMSDFANTKSYLKEVVRQANVSYDMQLYDCCAVMVRRLLEALIIEAYLKAGRQDEIKDGNDDYKMFNGLLTHINKDAKSLGLGRNTPKHLQDTKELADKSAHAINFNVKKKLIDDKKHDFQLAVAELKQFAFDN